MARMQKFIVVPKKEDKRLREEDEQKDDPFEKKEKKKVVVEKMLEYADEREDTFNMQMKRYRDVGKKVGRKVKEQERCRGSWKEWNGERKRKKKQEGPRG